MQFYNGDISNEFMAVCVVFKWIDSHKIVSFLTLQRLDKKGVSFCTRTTYEDNAITNAVEIYDSLRYQNF